MHFSAELFIGHFSTGVEVSNGHFGTKAKMWDTSTKHTPRCLRSEVSVLLYMSVHYFICNKGHSYT